MFKLTDEITQTVFFSQCTKKVIESDSPRFRNLTNSLYTPIVALKYADETGGLSVNTFYNLLFNLGPLMHITMNILKCLTCSCLRRRTISPDWGQGSTLTFMLTSSRFPWGSAEVD